MSFKKIGKDSYQKSKPTFIENWKNLTSRPTTINNDNFFVCTGKVSGITIIDVDRKNNKDGFVVLSLTLLIIRSTMILESLRTC